MNADDDFEDVRALLRQVDPGRAPQLVPAALMRRGRRRHHIETAGRWAELVVVLGVIAGGAMLLVGSPRNHKVSPAVTVRPTPTITSPATTTPACSAAQLTISLRNTAAAAGTIGGYLTFTNKSPDTCQITGWPDVVGLGPGAPTTRAYHVTSTMFGPNVNQRPVVMLQPGAHADAVVTGSDNPGGGATTCPAPYHSLRVAPPGSATSVTISAWLPYANAYLASCNGIQVSMIVSPADLYHG